MSCLSDFDYSSISFDDFMSYPSKVRKKILNDPELVKIMVKRMLKEGRYLHSLSVADTARELARYHGVDPGKAYMAGLLHDVTKYLSDEEQDEYLRYCDPAKLDYPPKTKHAYTAKYFLKEKCNFHDKDILHAVYNHTICISKDRPSRIIYIADKREPLRGVNDGSLELAKKDLNRAFEQVKNDAASYMRKRGTDERIITDSV